MRKKILLQHKDARNKKKKKYREFRLFYFFPYDDMQRKICTTSRIQKDVESQKWRNINIVLLLHKKKTEIRFTI